MGISEGDSYIITFELAKMASSVKHFIAVVAVGTIFFQSLIGNYIYMVEGIIGRDLVLTPKQGLQLNGKSIYYEEQSSSSKRAWEYALKHVTYLTLFSDATEATVDGNISQLRNYREFLKSPYILVKSAASGQGYGQRYNSQFGDIVTLASGRLEEIITNHSFRFIEGRTSTSACADEYCKEKVRTWAVWQVQKIRHHDVMDINKVRSNAGSVAFPLSNRKYRYELKLSVTPLKPLLTSTENDHNHETTHLKRKVNESFNSQQQRPQSFIQKEDDYPQSFGRIIYNDKRDLDALAERRFDGTGPVPQSTFMHGIFQAAQPPLLTPSSLTRLNIGEYLKGANNNNEFVPTPQFPLPSTKATPKIELFPNIFNLGNFLTPTTFRPSYRMKFPRPEIYHQQQHEFPISYHSTNGVVLDESSDDGGTGGTVTHHFHHHFYMPQPATSLVGGGGSSNEELYQTHHTETHDSLPLTTTAGQNNYFTYTTTRPAARLEREQHSHSFSKSSRSREHEHGTDDDGHPTLLVEVTPAPPLPLRQPQFYEGQTDTYQPSQTPSLLIYAGSEEKSEEDKKGSSSKPFVQSEPIEEQNSRYSEPDPLYHHIQPNKGDGSEQLESPRIDLTSLDPTYQQEQGQNKRQEEFTTPLQKSQLNIDLTYQQEQGQNKSQEQFTTPCPKSQLNIEEEKDVDKRGQSNVSNATATTTATATLIPTSNNNTFSSSNIVITKGFVSTSTTTSPLRALSRYRGAGTTTSQTGSISSKRSSITSSITSTTTEVPLAMLSRTHNNKWKLRHNNTISPPVTSATEDNKAKDSLRHESKIVISTSPHIKKMSFKRFTTAAASDATRIPTTTIKPINNQQEQNQLLIQSIDDANKIYEVLTQKSVSKSISIKVGDNGEEIPIIVDDDANDIIGKNKSQHIQ